MLTDGLQLLGTSTATNFAIEVGATFPVTATAGELFFKTGVGLHVHDGATWVQVGAADELTNQAVIDALGFTPASLSNGKLTASQIPAIAITDTTVVASQAAMLALTAEVGDVAVRTDLNKTFILKAEGATVLANWQELLMPTSDVTSVNGLTGTVTLTTSNVAEGTNQYFTNARARGAISVDGAGGSYNSSTGVITIAAASSSNFTLTNGAGGTGQIQFNSSGVLTGTDKFNWFDSSSTLQFGNASQANVTLTVATQTANALAASLTLIGASNGGNGGQAGGNTIVQGGTGSTVGGIVYLVGGGTSGTVGGNAIIRGGVATNVSGTGGSIQFQTHTGGAATYLDRLVITNSGEWKLAGSAGTSGQVLTSGGAGAAPTWATVAAGTGDFKANGTVSMTAPLVLANGTNLLPSLISALGTADTGLYFPATDQIAFSIAGSQRLSFASTHVTSAGPIFFGTASESAHVFFNTNMGDGFGAIGTDTTGSRLWFGKTPGYTGTSPIGKNFIYDFVSGITTFGVSPVAPTTATAENSTKVATTAFVRAAIAAYPPAAGAAAAGTLTGTTLAANVVTASLTTIQPATTTAGAALNISSGTPTDGAGGTLSITSASGVGTNRAGGGMFISNGSSTGAAAGSILLVQAGAGGPNAGGDGGELRLRAGNSGGGSGAIGGTLSLYAGSGGTIGGAITFLTASSTNTWTERFRITNSGALAFNGAANYGSAGQVLTSAGNGTPSWTTFSPAASALSGTTLATGVVTASLTNINSTQLQLADAAGTGVGKLVFGGTSTTGGTIQGLDNTAGASSLTVRAGFGTFGGQGGSTLILRGGQNGSSVANSVGGNVQIEAGAGFASGTVGGGNVDIKGGIGSNGIGGDVMLSGGVGNTNANGGVIRVITAATERFRVTATGAVAFSGAANYGTAGQVLTSNGNATPSWGSVQAPLNYMHVREVQPLGTGAGSSPAIAGEEFTRVLNTVVTNEIAGASLSSNSITLPPGKYYIKLYVPGSSLQARFFTATESLQVVTDVSGGGVNYSAAYGAGVLTVASTSVFSLLAKTMQGAAPLGRVGSLYTEVYSQVEIWKL